MCNQSLGTQLEKKVQTIFEKYSMLNYKGLFGGGGKEAAAQYGLYSKMNAFQINTFQTITPFKYHFIHNKHHIEVSPSFLMLEL
jgi:hypothetical protein